MAQKSVTTLPFRNSAHLSTLVATSTLPSASSQLYQNGLDHGLDRVHSPRNKSLTSAGGVSIQWSMSLDLLSYDTLGIQRSTLAHWTVNYIQLYSWPTEYIVGPYPSANPLTTPIEMALPFKAGKLVTIIKERTWIVKTPMFKLQTQVADALCVQETEYQPEWQVKVAKTLAQRQECMLSKNDSEV